MWINLPEAHYPRAVDQLSFHRRLKAKLEALPGIEIASLGSSVPAGPVRYFPYELDSSDPDHHSFTVGLVIGADYFRVLQVRPRRGRVFTRVRHAPWTTDSSGRSTMHDTDARATPGLEKVAGKAPQAAHPEPDNNNRVGHQGSTPKTRS